MKKVSLVLSGGGARGIAHVGVCNACTVFSGCDVISRKSEELEIDA
jgi:predicted patatin/cPLA2 family phospholipase